MVCLRNISVDTLHKGDTEDNNNSNNNNNNNNTSVVYLFQNSMQKILGHGLPIFFGTVGNLDYRDKDYCRITVVNFKLRQSLTMQKKL